MQPGDRVNWSYMPRGGYGFAQQVAGVVVGRSAKRVTIKVARKDGNEWVLEERRVSLDKLTPRTRNCPELGE